MSNDEEYSIRPIGVIESCFPTKFGTPRQSGLSKSARGRVVFDSSVPRDATRGLESFSHVWLVFLFDQVPADQVRWLVRPPRLGGNEKFGVFGTRSPFRPNRLGLSLVKLESITPKAIEISGLDLVEGTPVFDIKPYLPYVESIPDAKGGFTDSPPDFLEVEFPPKSDRQISDQDRELIKEVLGADPRPAYHDDPNRVYHCQVSGLNVRWRVEDQRAIIVELSRF